MPRNLNLYADRPRIHADGPKTPQKQTSGEEPKAQREAALRETVLENVGTPDDLHRVDIKKLQDEFHYRINIYRWMKNVSRFTDSYYVVITPDGVMSSPGMEKKYYDADLRSLWKSMSDDEKAESLSR